MTDEQTTPTLIDTSDPARLARGWSQARRWLAALLALLNLAAGALPPTLALSRRLRLDALKQVRILEALVRRLALAMASEAPWPACAPRPAISSSRPLPPGVTGSTRIFLDPARLGLARHGLPPPAPPPPEASLAPRKPVAPTVSLVEAWPDLRPDGDRGRPPACAARIMACPPRIRSFDATWVPTPEVPPPAPPEIDPARLLKRIAALQAVVANPDRMVRRMAGWLARRNPDAGPAWRPHPLSIGLPRLGLDPDQRLGMGDAHDLARRLLWRRDTS